MFVRNIMLLCHVNSLSLNITVTKKIYNNYRYYLQIYQQAHGGPYIVHLTLYVISINLKIGAVPY